MLRDGLQFRNAEIVGEKSNLIMISVMITGFTHPWSPVATCDFFHAVVI